MLLFPEKTKFKKQHKNLKLLKQRESNLTQPHLGFSGLKIINSFRVTAIHIEAVKKVITRIVKRKHKYRTKLRFMVFPNTSVTKKSAGIRMGKGKGKVAYWCFLLKQGRMFCEFDYNKVPLGILFSAFALASNKLPKKTSIIL
jgi:large subunit ribosomal protein L16